MLHSSRGFRAQPATSILELTENLCRRSWTLCTAFRFGDYLFLNDANHPDDDPLYVIVKVSHRGSEPFRQIRCLNIAPSDPEKKLAFLRRVIAGQFDGDGHRLRNLYLESAADHDCHHCA